MPLHRLDALIDLTRWLHDQLRGGLAFATHDSCPVRRTFWIQRITVRVEAGRPLFCFDVGPFLPTIAFYGHPQDDVLKQRHVTTRSVRALGLPDDQPGEIAQPATAMEHAAWLAWSPKGLDPLTLPVVLQNGRLFPPDVPLDAWPESNIDVSCTDGLWTTGLFQHTVKPARTLMVRDPDAPGPRGFGTLSEQPLPRELSGILDRVGPPGCLTTLDLSTQTTQHARVQAYVRLQAFNTVLDALGHAPVPLDSRAYLDRREDRATLGSNATEGDEGAQDAIWPTCTVVQAR